MGTVQNKQCNVIFAQMTILMFVQCNVIFVQQTMQVESTNVCSLLPHELCLFDLFECHDFVQNKAKKIPQNKQIAVTIMHFEGELNTS